MFAVFKVGRVRYEAVCKGKSIARAGLDGKAILRSAESPGKTVTRTLHQTEAVCVGRKNVFRIQKDHRIEAVVGVQTLRVIAVAIHLAALNMEKVMRVVHLPERHPHG